MSIRDRDIVPAPPLALFIVPSVAKVNYTSGLLRQCVLSIFLFFLFEILQAQRDDVALPCPNIGLPGRTRRPRSGRAEAAEPRRVVCFILFFFLRRKTRKRGLCVSRVFSPPTFSCRGDDARRVSRSRPRSRRRVPRASTILGARTRGCARGMGRGSGGDLCGLR